MSKLLRAYDRSPVALYIQVASVLKQRIVSGSWKPGQQISTIDDLEREFEVARVTVRQALDMLRDEGLLHSRQGRGTFVAHTGPRRHWLTLASDWSGLLEQIKDNVPAEISVDEPAPAPSLQPRDGQAASGYVLIRSVQHKDGEPYSIVRLHLAAAVFDRARDRFMKAAALKVIAELPDVTIGGAHQTMTIGSATPDVADLLAVPIGAPTADCRCVIVDEARIAIYVAEIVYRGDCIKLEIDLQ